jgi:hypothetical protein
MVPAAMRVRIKAGDAQDLCCIELPLQAAHWITECLQRAAAVAIPDFAGRDDRGREGAVRIVGIARQWPVRFAVDCAIDEPRLRPQSKPSRVARASR